MPQIWDTYREKALELCARANKQAEFALQAKYEALAFLYLDFAVELESQALRQSEVAS